METIARTNESLDKKFWEVVSPLANEFKFEETFTAELNDWWRVQGIAEATNYIVTPANGMDVAGFALSMYGLQHLDSWGGIAAAGTGFMTDVLDGRVARRTLTQSALGEAIDAGGDKVKLAFCLYKLWRLDLAPKPLIVAIAVQNGINVGLTAIDQATNDKPVLHPTQFGKKAIFMEQWGLGLHVIGNKVAQTNEKRGKAIKTAGTVISMAGVTVGAVATVGYTSVLYHNRIKH